jgi:hypothetical protein
MPSNRDANSNKLINVESWTNLDTPRRNTQNSGKICLVIAREAWLMALKIGQTLPNLENDPYFSTRKSRERISLKSCKTMMKMKKRKMSQMRIIIRMQEISNHRWLSLSKCIKFKISTIKKRKTFLKM